MIVGEEIDVAERVFDKVQFNYFSLFISTCVATTKVFLIQFYTLLSAFPSTSFLFKRFFF